MLLKQIKHLMHLRKILKYIEAKKKLVQVVVAKDMAMAKLKKIQSTMKSLGNAVAKPIVMAKDKATSMIKGISSKLGALAKGIAIPLTIATAGAGAAIKGGMELEQQQISMRHFMGVGNAGKSDKELLDLLKANGTQSYKATIKVYATALQMPLLL